MFATDTLNTSQRAADEREIRARYAEMLDAWTRGDAEAYGAPLTEDVDYMPYDGTRLSGRQAVVDSHDQLFRGVLYGSSLVGEVESIRYVHPDVAVVHATGSVLVPWRSKLPRRRLSRQTLVAVRTDDGWKFTAFQNGRVRPVRIPEPTSLPAKAARLLARLARLAGIGHRSAR